MFDSCCPHYTPYSPQKQTCVSFVAGGYCTRDDQFRCPEFIKRSGEVPLSHTAIKEYCHCHRKFYYSNLLGLQAIEPSWQLKQGSRASTILGWLHSNRLTSDSAITMYTDFILTEIGESRDPQDPEDVGALNIWAMKAMFDVYIELGWHKMKGVTEYEFRWDIPEYPRVHGFIDLYLPDGQRGVEFKWTGSPQWYEKFHMEDQLMSYFIGAPLLTSFEVRLFIPPMIKFKKGETISELFDRTLIDVRRGLATEYCKAATYYRHEFDLDAYKDRARMISAEIVRYFEMAERTVRPEYPFYQDKTACFSPVECDFLKICKYDLDRPPENMYKKRERR